ncbi:17679_t:CDS:1, partial [Gigaspora rosea]
KHREKEEANKDRKTTKKRKFKDAQNSVVSQQGTTSNFEEMDGHVQMDLQSKFENLQVRNKGSKVGAQAHDKQGKFRKRQGQVLGVRDSIIDP